MRTIIFLLLLLVLQIAFPVYGCEPFNDVATATIAGHHFGSVNVRVTVEGSADLSASLCGLYQANVERYCQRSFNWASTQTELASMLAHYDPDSKDGNRKLVESRKTLSARYELCRFHREEARANCATAFTSTTALVKKYNAAIASGHACRLDKQLAARIFHQADQAVRAQSSGDAAYTAAHQHFNESDLTLAALQELKSQPHPQVMRHPAGR